jgi:hypothetical protein
MMETLMPLFLGVTLGYILAAQRMKPQAMPIMIKEILPIPLTDYDPAKHPGDMAEGSKLIQVSESLAGRIQFPDGTEKWVWRAGGRVWTMDADKIPNMRDYR